ncbi:monooxygenase [Loigolactobacillus iwatensis]|uniref:monooxygenase n=1 Tax=Loigolactobacillus iwatensis TaxID=1267156 RepID=UPI000F7EB18E|nr:monooxygenase [Loigolactobacillus iwatensis]
MLKKIQATFGSQDILTDYFDREPQRNLLLLRPAESTNDFQLLDVSGQENFFNSPISYSVRQHLGKQEFSGFFNFMYFTFPSEDAVKVFQSQFDRVGNQAAGFIGLNSLFLLRLDAPQIQFVILSIWQREADYFNWRNSQDFSPLLPYLQAGPNIQQFHQTTYTLEQTN